ncbi:hypothetical protein ACWEQL_08260 [Kitasatospora sp. NPDC004240]
MAYGYPLAAGTGWWDTLPTAVPEDLDGAADGRCLSAGGPAPAEP